MREIKFRGFYACQDEDEQIFIGGELVNGAWVYGYVWKNGRGQYFITEYNGLRMYAVIPETVGQYTGLKDKSGNEIYQGDIIKGFIPEIANEPERKGIVKWGLYGWIVDFKLPKYESGIGIVGFCSFRNYEVIGNIYDNSELLKGEIYV